MGKPSMKNMITYLAIVSLLELYTNLRESRVTGSLFLMVIFTVFRWVFIATSTPVIVPCTWCCIVSNLWKRGADDRAFRIHQTKWREWTTTSWSNRRAVLAFFLPGFHSSSRWWQSRERASSGTAPTSFWPRCVWDLKLSKLLLKRSIFHEKLDYNQRENESQGRRFRLFMRRRHWKSFGAQQRLNAALSHELGT